MKNLTKIVLLTFSINAFAISDEELAASRDSFIRRLIIHLFQALGRPAMTLEEYQAALAARATPPNAENHDHDDDDDDGVFDTGEAPAAYTPPITDTFKQLARSVNSARTVERRRGIIGALNLQLAIANYQIEVIELAREHSHGRIRFGAILRNDANENDVALANSLNAILNPASPAPPATTRKRNRDDDNDGPAARGGFWITSLRSH